MAQDVDPIDWDSLSADLDYQALDDTSSLSTVDPSSGQQLPAPQTPSRTTTDWER
ncbi:hypothetical protein [Brevibacterium aurantiacum]|uniref:hypothetical protein n=1 Tax=Brevibacterium aurantiacum TaxID=273384 RepID=UPI0015E070CA|nr:hypothetical protein [Brevibacterium aurantiacum]